MRLISDYNALTIVGLWNRHIITTEWVGKFLLPSTTLSGEFPLNFNGSMRISSDSLRLFIVANRLQFAPIKTSPEVFNLIQDLSIKMATYLPHTPVSAFGVNFLFECLNTELNFDCLTLPDINVLTAIGLKPSATSYRHSFPMDGYSLNLSASSEKESVRFDFNFHFDVDSLSAFKDRISLNPILKLKAEAEKILSTCYLKPSST